MDPKQDLPLVSPKKAVGPDSQINADQLAKASQMSFGEHLEELRSRILNSLYAFFGVLAVCLLDQQFFMKMVLLPHSQAMKALQLPPTIQVLHYEESFFAHLQVACIATLILTMPYIFYQLWLFISAGLYAAERKYFKLFCPVAVGLFIIGVIFGYAILIPLGLRFLASYGVEEIRVGFTLSSYLSLFFILTIVSGVIFELPLAMLFLTMAHLLNTQFYIAQWRYFVLFAFVLAAILTPPDVVTQILMAIPLVFLYGLGILICRVAERIDSIRIFLKLPGR